MEQKRVCNWIVKMAGYGAVPHPSLQFKGVVRLFSPALRSVFCPGECTMLVRDVLHTKGNRVISIDSAATVHEAVAKLVQNNIGSLPVVDQDCRLIGIFAERDVLRIMHNRGEGFGRISICQVMTPDPVTCDIHDDVNEVMGQMSERRIAKVPVLEEGKLVGIISVGDVIKVMYDKVATENQHLLSYIQGAV
jgi:CBS domain-containing protein